ncbi:2-C-methyl-D-erythritol 2,4-cyclodiphosphate synthase [Luteibaculum oceani]|uniref:2-C-methyl-D-erythritol 2,4-cyclodiphosphate synthase n=1 Tax=Luteibaculum oceani TaxID=1294296 RepID=A0A5C6UZJ1_9FLAO|nr:2-C-methyl-D-erythritol 2,4-cyclodiphosphate synthase [Luteibaculum oceani]TXC78329.1 2-C-methyl-D-erythritol 2,4-cyclodiphosphate synthase [Luteibaculum oceani]
MDFRVGFGYDVHRLVYNRPCIIGGVEIPFFKGLLGHSDADVLLHAITDALLGALALGDIGTHFPDTDPKYKNADSAVLLKDAYVLVGEKGYELNNLDATVAAQYPKMKPYIPQIRERIASLLDVEMDRISIKATTTEGLGFVGKEEGIAAYANVSVISR